MAGNCVIHDELRRVAVRRFYFFSRREAPPPRKLRLPPMLNLHPEDKLAQVARLKQRLVTRMLVREVLYDHEETQEG